MSDGGGGGTLVSRFKGSTYVGAPINGPRLGGA